MEYLIEYIRYFIEYSALLGLGANFVGAIFIAVAQNYLSSVVNDWLLALDRGVITAVEGCGPVFRGWDKQMKKAVSWARHFSTFGWILFVIGVVLQVPAALPK